VTIGPGGGIIGGAGGAGNSSTGSERGGTGAAGGFGMQLGAGATVTVAAGGQIVGGAGGAGGNGPFFFGGDGGRGGFGLEDSNMTLNNSGTIAGGSGGVGGAGALASGISQRGGMAVFGSNLTIVNTGTITGGAGGTGGPATTGGSFGINASNLNLTNSGTIAGGLLLDGVTRDPAINLFGGTNVITFTNSTSGLLGGINLSPGTSLQMDPAAGGTTVSSVISGAGEVRKGGSGTLILTGINTYTGFTTVNAGTLAVNGSTAPSTQTFVNASATLSGTGTVGNTVINGGTLAPGNSIGTLNVQGNLILNAAATYLVEVDPNGADRTNVTGAAALGGATVSAIYATSTSYVTRRYTIVSANGGLVGHLQHAGQHQPAGEFYAQPRLRRQQRLSRPDAELLAHTGRRRRPQSQPDQRCECAGQLVQHCGRHSARLRRADAGWPDDRLGRSCDRRAADDVQCDGPVHLAAERSVPWGA
jgi:autotransporter-associated beta strand protein